LLQEIELRHSYLHEDIISLYFGGGTPSLMNADQLNKITDQLSRHYDLSKLKEVTLEANPDDISKEKVAELGSTLINRISLGVQSFHQQELIWMHRAHDSQQSRDSIKMLQDGGFSNISIDLIYGSPGLTDEQWLEDLETAFSLGVTHMSCYALTLEKGTAFEKLVQAKRTTAPDDEKQSRHFSMLMNEIEKRGWEQYEISNFCKDGNYAIHNSSYWKGSPYLGLGPSAHSYNGYSRQWNVRNLDIYIDSLKEGKQFWEREEIDARTAYNEYIMTSLRTKWGSDIEKIRALGFEKHFLKELKNPELSSFLQENNGVYTLTREGKFYADRVASELFKESE
jgi:oxygen-independent coproporphyrinogen III oxidase